MSADKLKDAIFVISSFFKAFSLLFILGYVYSLVFRYLYVCNVVGWMSGVDVSKKGKKKKVNAWRGDLRLVRHTTDWASVDEQLISNQASNRN